MSNAILNNVYNHYLTAYAPKSTGKFDTHKKSELRSIYNSIVKMNKDAPLYLLDTSVQAQECAVGMKENARELKNTIASLGGFDQDKLLNNRVASSSNEDIVSAQFIGSYTKGQEIPSLEISVLALASEQVNLGEFLLNEKAELSPNTYSFDITINDLSYEFQFNIKEDDTNRDIQERLARLVTNADIGLKAEVIGDANGRSALSLTSTATGLPAGKEQVFTVSDTHTSKTAGAVDYFGLAYVARDASNARFTLNGEEHTSYANHFTVDQTYELQLHSISDIENDSTVITLKPDVESLTDNIHQLIHGYNSFMKNAMKYSAHSTGTHLVKEMNSLSSYYRSNLDAIGLTLDDQGTFQIDDNLLKQSALEGNDTSFRSMKEFTTSLLKKTEQVSLNPMQYVNKTIVAYKNPGHNFASPYITSAYSGMIFNSYC